MAKYHKYIFDTRKRKFIGKFEEMYANEKRENYDSWFQEDLRGMKYVLSNAILGQYNFNRVLDLGCGKGVFSHTLKKKNNEVLGIDLSKTAVEKARASFPDIKLKVARAEEILQLNQKFDLVVAMEIMSYLRSWPEIIKKIAKATDYVFISLFLPPNPIGFVKSFDELSTEIEKYFDVITKIIDTIGSDMFILARVKKGDRRHSCRK